FQLVYLRFTQPRADPTAFAAMRSQALALLGNQTASPDVVFNQAVAAALNGDSPRRQPETPAIVERWNLEKSLAFYQARFAGASVYDDANNRALQTVTLLLQSRLSDAIREELGGTYNIAVNSEAAKNPRPQYRVRIDWTCDPARTAGLVQRVMEEVSFVRKTLLSPEQVSRVRTILMRDAERDSRENEYLLAQISRRYDDGDASNVGTAVHSPQQISELNGAAIQLAAQRYLDTQNYLRGTVIPATK